MIIIKSKYQSYGGKHLIFILERHKPSNCCNNEDYCFIKDYDGFI